MTSLLGSQAVEPFGRRANRTSTQPGLVATTGSTEGRSYQVAGTVSVVPRQADAVPAASRPGRAYTGASRSTVASTVLPAAWAAAAWCRCAAWLAFGTGTDRGGAPADGRLLAESSRPAETAAATAPITLTVIAARFFPFAAPTGRKDTAALRFTSGQLHIVTMPQASSLSGSGPVIAENSACLDRR